MSFVQPTVFRLYFSTEPDVTAAQRQLNNLDIRPDYIKAFNRDEPTKWKMIFAEENFIKATTAISQLNVKPVKVDYFDPQASWADEFKPLV